MTSSNEILNATLTPKIFISYSWSTPAHIENVQSWTDRLIADGIETIIDVYDLKEGHDKFVFMEGMVTDQSITHVLVICDKEYAHKADQRKAGVGTESQIISKEVYGKVKQSKFIPIVCEFADNGEPYLPTFLGSRIWINFSTPENVNKNWERLVRLLYGKPALRKPDTGKAPSYITQDSTLPPIPTTGKLSMLRESILQGKPGVRLYRADFLQSCLEYIDSNRRRSEPESMTPISASLADYSILKPIRDQIVDWVILDSSSGNFEKDTYELIEFLEKLLALKYRPNDLTGYTRWWLDAHALFVYENFLYIVAALIKCRDDSTLHEVFITRYHLPEAAHTYESEAPSLFTVFYAYSDLLNNDLCEGDMNFLSGTAEMINRNSDRSDIPFDALKEAELLAVLMQSLLDEDSYYSFWYPGTLNYGMRRSCGQLFRRATQKRGYERLAMITGIKDSAELANKAKAGLERARKIGCKLNVASLVSQLNLENLNTL